MTEEGLLNPRSCICYRPTIYEKHNLNQCTSTLEKTNGHFIHLARFKKSKQLLSGPAEFSLDDGISQAHEVEIVATFMKTSKISVILSPWRASFAGSVNVIVS